MMTRMKTMVSKAVATSCPYSTLSTRLGTNNIHNIPTRQQNTNPLTSTNLSSLFIVAHFTHLLMIFKLQPCTHSQASLFTKLLHFLSLVYLSQLELVLWEDSDFVCFIHQCILHLQNIRGCSR